MNNIGIPPTAFANFVPPYHPSGKPVVGLENPDAKGELLSPIEETPEPEAALNEDDNSKLKRKRFGLPIEGSADKDQQSQQQQDQQQIQALASRDREVRAHERAHASVGGQFTSAPRYEFQRGPDGVNYAVGGEVSISLPTNQSSPEATLQALEQVKRAALAPAKPSQQDRQVAARASQQSDQLLAAMAVSADVPQPLETQEALATTTEQTALQSDNPPAISSETHRVNRQLADGLITSNRLEDNSPVGRVFNLKA